MNWYKMANPLLDKIKSEWMDIGHNYKEEAYMWVIYRGFIFDQREAESTYTHYQWFGDESGPNIIARGRYENGEVSMALSNRYRYSPSKDKVVNKVISILDREYDNP